MIITSSSNEQIKNIIQLREKARARKSQECFLVEGMKMVGEAPEEEIVKIYISESFSKENDTYRNSPKVQVVSDSVFKKISDTVTPQGIMAVVKQKKYQLEDLMKTVHDGKNCFVVLDRLQDPGNMGTIIRTGEGAGINGVIMSSSSVDVYNPKVIRSTMGSIFRVPFVVVDNLPEAIQRLKNQGITTYAAHLKGESYNKEAFPEKSAILIGNEANGLSGEVSACADKLIKIPMKGKVESLNAAIATSILMYQILN